MMVKTVKKPTLRLWWPVFAVIFLFLSLVFVVISFRATAQTSYLQPVRLPQDIRITDSYLNVSYPSDVRPIGRVATYVISDPNMTVTAYRKDDDLGHQLDCTQQVQDQTCTRKVTRGGLTYFVFDSLNGTLGTHSIRVKATVGNDVIDIRAEPPLTDDLNAAYDWSDTLDSMTLLEASTFPVRETRSAV